VVAGNVPHHYFLDSCARIHTGAGLGPLHIMLVSTRLAERHGYIADLLANRELLDVYWHGGTPMCGRSARGFPRLELVPHGALPEVNQLAVR
jgi:hypothetical protein